MNSFVPPKYGAQIILVCTRCNKTFIGPNPKASSPADLLLKAVKPARCPNCGSLKVVPGPRLGSRIGKNNPKK